MSEILTHVLAFVGGGGVFSVVTFFVTRHYARQDKHEDLRVAAYREVLASVSALRAAMERLESEFDYSQEPRHQDFAPTNELQVKTGDLIERHRADTGHAFADAAKF